MDLIDFGREVDAAARRYFDEVLPAFVDRFYRGAGREFLWRLLDAHDRKDLSAIAGVGARPRARKLARRVRAQCPLEVVEAAWPPAELAAFGGQPALVLGLFGHDEVYVRETVAVNRTVHSERRVSIFYGSFLALGWDDARVREEIFWTVFHEYVHYFESFLLRREQVLRGREEADARVRALDLAHSRRLDRRAQAWRAVRWSFGLAALAGCLAVPIFRSGEPAPPPPVVVRQVSPAEQQAQRAAESVRIREGAEAVEVALQFAQSAHLPPEGIETVLGLSAVYAPSQARPVLADPQRLSPDRDAGLPLHAEGSVAEAWWVLPTEEVFPVHLRGLGWLPDGGSVLLAATAP